jgi:hypothetical protein
MSATNYRRSEEKPQSLASYLAQGAGFIVFLVGLFALAGFRG